MKAAAQHLQKRGFWKISGFTPGKLDGKGREQPASFKKFFFFQINDFFEINVWSVSRNARRMHTNFDKKYWLLKKNKQKKIVPVWSSFLDENNFAFEMAEFLPGSVFELFFTYASHNGDENDGFHKGDPIVYF